jgi:hypothetical protein
VLVPLHADTTGFFCGELRLALRFAGVKVSQLGKETPLLRHFYTKKPSFYQARLRTNIGKALKKRVAFP